MCLRMFGKERNKQTEEDNRLRPETAERQKEAEDENIRHSGPLLPGSLYDFR